MKVRRFEVTMLTRPTPIDINRLTTWPEALRSTIRELDRRTASTPYVGDLRISEEAGALVAETIIDHAVIARHYTRLLPHEGDWIRAVGLLMYSKELFDQRIDGARQFGYLGADIGPHLKSGTIPVAEAGERGDRGFVCMTIGPVMETDFSAVSPLLGNWGGERHLLRCRNRTAQDCPPITQSPEQAGGGARPLTGHHTHAASISPPDRAFAPGPLPRNGARTRRCLFPGSDSSGCDC